MEERNIKHKLKVLCINKNNRTNPHERITHIGGLNSNSTEWHFSLQDAIRFIESCEFSFFVNKDGISVEVRIIERPGHQKFLTTTRDDTKDNNLLSLIECPINAKNSTLK